jgi:hypothetical protein
MSRYKATPADKEYVKYLGQIEDIRLRLALDEAVGLRLVESEDRVVALVRKGIKKALREVEDRFL